MRLLVEDLHLSLAIGLLGWWILGDCCFLVAAVISGWLIDTDLWIDFGQLPFSSDGYKSGRRDAMRVGFGYRGRLASTCAFAKTINHKP